MLGMYNLLPLLKGWEYKPRVWTRTVKRGETIEVDRVAETGWLLDISVLTDDCYGGLILEWQGADLELHSVYGYPETLKRLGGFPPDPAGWVPVYNRPNPKSTAGLYFCMLFSGGYQGSVLPYVPTTIAKLALGEESTQTEAIISGAAMGIAITSPQLFMRSLRSVLGMPVILPIDPSLLEPGREPLTLKGPLEKKEGK